MNDFLQSLRGGQKDKRVSKTRRGFDNNQHFNSPSHFHSQPGYQNTRGGNIKRGVRPPHPGLGQADTAQQIVPDTMETIAGLLEIMTKNQELLISVEERRVIAEERKAIALEDIAEYLKFSSSPVSGEIFNENEPRQFSQTSLNTEPIQPAEIKTEIPAYEAAETLQSEQNNPRLVQIDRSQQAVQDENALPEIPVDEPQTPTEKPVKVLKRTRAQKLKIEKKAASQKPERKNEILSREEVMEIIRSMRAKGATFDQVAKHFADLGQPTFSGRGEWHAQTVHRLCNKRK